MTTHILYLWAISALTSSSMGIPIVTEREWRPMGEYRTQADCDHAAAQLALQAKSYRCISTGKPA